MNNFHTVQFYSPSVGDAPEVVKQVSERLVKRGHNVTAVTTRLAEPYLKRLPASCSLYSPRCGLIACKTSEALG